MALDPQHAPPTFGPDEKEAQEKLLLVNITARLPELERALEAVNEKWVYENLMYRYYHQSLKVYGIQQHSLVMADLLQSLAPHLPLNRWFQDLVRTGTGREFRLEDNENWQEITRPMLEAFFHARYFLEMICKYGRQLTQPPQMMPSGWAAVLYLFNIR